MAINSLNPVTDAVIDKKFRDLVTGTSYPPAHGDTIYLTSYQPNELIYKYSAATEKLIVFSEIYYPAGWKCYVDGTEKPYMRANYVLRAMVAPAGDHEIKFSFNPESFVTGNKVSLASSILLFLLAGGFIANELIRKKKQQ